MVVIYHLLQEVLSFYNASFLHLGEKIVGIELKHIIEWDTLTVLLIRGTEPCTHGSEQSHLQLLDESMIL